MAEDPRIFLHFKTFSKFQEKLNDGTINENKHFVVIKDEGLIWVKGKFYADNNRLEDLDSYYNDWELTQSNANTVTIVLKGKEWEKTDENDRGRWVDISKTFTLNSASESIAGLMSASDKTKLNKITGTNYTISNPSSTGTSRLIKLSGINPNTGAAVESNITIPDATQTVAGLMNATDKKAIDNLSKLESFSHINDGSAFSRTADNVALNYECRNVTDNTTADNETHSEVIEAADASNAGVMTAQDKRQLDIINTANFELTAPTTTTTSVILHTKKTDVNAEESNKIDLETVADRTIPEATRTSAGVLNSTDKLTLDSLRAISRVSHVKHYEDAETSGGITRTEDTVNINYECIGNTEQSVTSRVLPIKAASYTKAGVMSADDKTELDRIETANFTLDSVTPTTSVVNISASKLDIDTNASVSNNITIPESTTSLAGVMSNSDKIATANLKTISAVTHMNDELTFTTTSTGAKFNYNCISTKTASAKVSAHSIDIPVADDSNAGIITAEEHKKLNTDIPQEIKDIISKLLVSGAQTASTAYTDLDSLGSDYSTLYELAKTVKSFLEASDTADDTINKWQEIRSFLEGFGDSDNLISYIEGEIAKSNAAWSDAIKAIDYNDVAVTNQFVTSVKQTDGKIAVTRARPSASNISNSVIAASTTQVGLAGTDVQTTIGNIATAIKTEETRAKGAESTLTTNLSTETSNRQNQDDVIEAAVGLNADGTHKTTTGNYTKTATTIAGEIALLDALVKVNADNYASIRAFKTISTDNGDAVADTIGDTLTVRGGTDMSTSGTDVNNADVLTITHNNITRTNAVDTSSTVTLPANGTTANITKFVKSVTTSGTGHVTSTASETVAIKHGSVTRTTTSSTTRPEVEIPASGEKVTIGNPVTSVDSNSQGHVVDVSTDNFTVKHGTVSFTPGTGNIVTGLSVDNGHVTGTTNKSLSGDITTDANLVATIGTNKVSNTKLAQMTANTLKGNNTSATANAKDLSVSDVKTMLGISNVADGAQVNQNAFSKVTVGSTTISSNSTTDTLTLAAGSNITLTADATNKKVTITGKDWTSDIESKIAEKLESSDAMIFKGTVSSNSGLPAVHSVGDTYKVAVAGTYAGVKCEVGDMIICVTNGIASNDAHWTVIQTNIDGAVTGPTSAVANRIAIFDGTTGKIIKDSGYSIGNASGNVPLNNGTLNVNLNSEKLGGLTLDQVRKTAQLFYNYDGTVGEGYDLNREDLTTKGGILHNYNSATYWKNAPNDFLFGAGLCLGDVNTSIRGMLAWDITHSKDVNDDMTRSLYWRAYANSSTAANSGWGKWHLIAFTDSNVASADSICGYTIGNIGNKIPIWTKFPAQSEFKTSGYLPSDHDPAGPNANEDYFKALVKWIVDNYTGEVLLIGKATPNSQGMLTIHVYDCDNKVGDLPQHCSAVYEGYDGLVTCFGVNAGMWKWNFGKWNGSALKLTTARTIWGQSFDGSANISGAMTGVGKISMSNNIVRTIDGTERNVMTVSKDTNANINTIIYGDSSEWSMLRGKEISFLNVVGETILKIRNNTITIGYNVDNCSLVVEGPATVEDLTIKDTTIGSSTQPIYLNDGKFTKCELPEYELPQATFADLGGIKVSATTSSITPLSISSTSSRTYAIQLTTDGQAVVNVPWTNTTYSNFNGTSAGLVPGFTGAGLSVYGSYNLHYLDQSGTWKIPIPPQATASQYGGFKIGYSQNAQNYAVKLDTNGAAYVNVPWENTTYSLATTTADGLMSSTQFTYVSNLSNALSVNDTKALTTRGAFYPIGGHTFLTDKRIYTRGTVDTTVGLFIGYSDSGNGLIIHGHTGYTLNETFVADLDDVDAGRATIDELNTTITGKFNPNFLVTNTRRIGVRTFNPTCALDVAGNIKCANLTNQKISNNEITTNIITATNTITGRNFIATNDITTKQLNVQGISRTFKEGVSHYAFTGNELLNLNNITEWSIDALKASTISLRPNANNFTWENKSKYTFYIKYNNTSLNVNLCSSANAFYSSFTLPRSTKVTIAKVELFIVDNTKLNIEKEGYRYHIELLDNNVEGSDVVNTSSSDYLDIVTFDALHLNSTETEFQTDGELDPGSNTHVLNIESGAILSTTVGIRITDTLNYSKYPLVFYIKIPSGKNFLVTITDNNVSKVVTLPTDGNLHKVEIIEILGSKHINLIY